MSLPEVHAVIFDMDGTMLDSEPIYRQAFVKAGQALNLPVTPQLFDTLVGLDREDTRKAVAAACGFEFDYDAFTSLFSHHWSQQVESAPTPLKPGLHEILDWLMLRSIPLGIATNSDRVQVDRGFTPHGLLERFATIVCNGDTPRGKPTADPYLEVAKRLDVAPRHCVVFEDSNTGVQSAVAAGMRVIVIPDIAEPDVHTRESAHAIVRDLHEALDHLRLIINSGELSYE
jgi:HAD superfamily hydrolase (TIGR01509 family)